MSGIGENKSSIQWTCDNCFFKFKCFRSFHLHRRQHCFPDPLIRKRFPKKTEEQIQILDQELPKESNQNIRNLNLKSNELSSISMNNSSNNNIPFPSTDGFVQSHDHSNDNLDYEGEDNDHRLDNSSQMDHVAALLGENSSILVNNKYITFQRRFLSLIKNPNGNIEGPPSNNNLNSPNNNNENELRSQSSGLSSHLSLGRVSSITRSIHANINTSPGSYRISTGYANPKDIFKNIIYC